MIGRGETTNYYEILEVPQNALQGEVYRAYQRAKATYSTENPALYSMFTPEETRELLKLIEEAYSVLSNASLRKNYDDNLSSRQNVMEQNISNFVNANNGVTAEPPKSNYSQKTEVPAQQAHFQTVEATDDYVIRKKDSSSQLPEGFGRTSLSTYKIDAKKEEMFAQTEHLDGAFLKSVREYKNLTIERVSDATRISRTYLTAVEANEYKELPAAVFVRGFIVQVARLLNLDETKVANGYMQIYRSIKKS